MSSIEKKQVSFEWKKTYSKKGPIGIVINKNGKTEVIFKKTYTETKKLSGLWNI